MAKIDSVLQDRLEDIKDNAEKMFKAMHSGEPKERSEFDEADPFDKDSILAAFDRDEIRAELAAIEDKIWEEASNFEQVLLMRETAALQQMQRAYLLRHRTFIQAVGQAAAQEELLSSPASPAVLCIEAGLQEMLEGDGQKGP